MFRRFNSGLSPSIYTLEDELYAEGLRSKNGKRVRANLIHTILTDVRYAGKVLYNGKIYDGQHDPIVDMAEIKKAKATLTKHNKGADRTRKHNWLLAGLVYCKTSGDLMTGEQHIKKSGLIFRHYRCLGPKNHDNPCNEPYAPMEKVNGQLEKHMKGIKFSPRFLSSLRGALLEVMHEQGKDTPARIESLGNRKIVVEKKMDKLEDQMISDLVPRDRIEPKYVPLREELKSIEGEIAKLKRPSANLDEKKIDTIIAFLQDLPKLWSAFQPEEKKQFLKWFVEKVWVQNRVVVGIDHTEAFQVCIDQDLVRIKSVWLGRWYDYRTIDWASEIEYPEFTMKQTQELLTISA